MNFSLSIFYLLSALVTAFAQTSLEVASYFRKHLSNTSTVYLPHDGNYLLETTQRWNAFSAPTYMISVKPTSDLDVQKIVRAFDPSKSQIGSIYRPSPLTISGQIEYAFLHNISFLGTGGGHGYSVTLDTVQSGIEIDLGHFDSVSIDQIANTMTVGGAVRFANITGRLYDAGKEFRT